MTDQTAIRTAVARERRRAIEILFGDAGQMSNLIVTPGKGGKTLALIEDTSTKTRLYVSVRKENSERRVVISDNGATFRAIDRPVMDVVDALAKPEDGKGGSLLETIIKAIIGPAVIVSENGALSVSAPFDAGCAMSGCYALFNAIEGLKGFAREMPN